MKPAQARKLIGDLLDWTDEEATQEFHWLDLMARYKFDHYQGYGPGRRFYVTLLRWLTQFEQQDRRTAYQLLRNHLIFIGQSEMHHLVGLSGPIILREMRRHVARLLGIPTYMVDEDPDAQRRLCLLQERTLYVGVSDGARIDVFRRYNEGTINNEQVVPMAEISSSKWKSLHKKLADRLSSKGHGEAAAEFEWVCLIDDFTGSARSSIWYDDAGSKWDGKVGKFVVSNVERNIHKLASKACIHVHHYLASAAAKKTIEQRVKAIGSEYVDLQFCSTFAYVLPESIRLQESKDVELLSLLKRHYDPRIENTHVGEDIWMGYKQCGLPLVLEHNTPNNSVAILWARSPDARSSLTDASKTTMSPLFPRRQRHLDVR